MIVKEYFYNLQCDRCCNLCDDEMWHIDESTVKAIAEESGWREIDGKHYCPDCYEVDDNDRCVPLPPIVTPQKTVTP